MTRPIVYHGDCRDVLRHLPSNSLDSCVTDPPYALVSVVKRFGSPTAAPAKGNDAYMRASAGFMGCNWDTGETAFSTEFWTEVYRVLKPGAHLAAFGASRGYHRMACAIEDAGFEIRDSLMWVYGTGFPKSQNVAKFIDKELEVAGTLGGPRSAAHADMLTRGVARRGEKHEGWDRPWMDDPEAIAAAQSVYIPGSPKAQEFDGFGTALKPAFEPIVLARKPLSEGTVAANVLKWRTGALNIDGCRVEAQDGANRARPPRTANEILGGGKGTNLTASPHNEAGRWPANVVHDGSDEVVGAFPHTKSGKDTALNPTASKSGWTGNGLRGAHCNHGDSGSAARFFYSAKANAKDRNGSKHPTVKPVALMQWLTRLITPPGGLVLDPFAGSGTTGAACVAEGFRAVLIEREDEYVADILRRFDNAA